MLYIGPYEPLRPYVVIYLYLFHLIYAIGLLLGRKNKSKSVNCKNNEQSVMYLDRIDEIFTSFRAQGHMTENEEAHAKGMTAFIRHILKDSEPLKTPDNSSQPPGKSIGPPKPKKKAAKKKFGGQKGHKGANHRREAKPDQVIVLECPEKDRNPDWVRVGVKWAQTLDIEFTRKVTEHQSIVYKNVVTGEIWSMELPEGRCGTVRVGNDLKTLTVLLKEAGHLSYERIKQFIGEVTYIGLSDATLIKIVKEVESSPVLFQFVECAENALLASPVNNGDESGISVNGHNAWDHVLANLEFVLHSYHKRRGKEAMDDIGILPNYTGILVHDCLPAYFQYEKITHALCGAHLLRELNCAVDMDQEWADSFAGFLSNLKDLVNLHGGKLPWKELVKAWDLYDKYIAKAYEATGGLELVRPEWQKGRKGRTAKPKYRSLLERLDKHKKAELRFTLWPNVPFTNNRAEQPIRQVKLHLKVSGCFRTEEMAKGFLRMRGYIDSCGKHGINSFQAIKMLLNGELPEFINKWSPESVKSAA